MRPNSFLTVEQYILNEQRRRHAHASGEFSWLLSGITLATKIVSAHIRRAGLVDVLGSAEAENVHGETQQKLDVLADQILLACLGGRGNVGILASEENEEPIVVVRDAEHGKYVVLFDPLDGSSNIDVGMGVGTIFSIFRRPLETADRAPLDDVLQRGVRQVAAGYVLYGSSTSLVFTTGHGVQCFVLDPSIGAYVLVRERVTMPERGKYYSVNEANLPSFPPAYRRFVEELRSGALGPGRQARYTGCLVADFHRVLLTGGVFLYPPTDRNPAGKLRLMYEANPIALLAEQAGGMAIDGRRRILDIPPESLHQRTPLAVGGRSEVSRLLALAAENAV